VTICFHAENQSCAIDCRASPISISPAHSFLWKKFSSTSFSRARGELEDHCKPRRSHRQRGWCGRQHLGAKGERPELKRLIPCCNARDLTLDHLWEGAELYFLYHPEALKEGPNDGNKLPCWKERPAKC
jgi:hypothetical protein